MPYIFFDARVDADGEMYFHDDIYARDAVVSKAWSARL